VCEERSCEPLHSIYGDRAPRSVKAAPHFCPANRSTAHRIENTDRKTRHFKSINIGLLIYYKRNAQRLLIVFIFSITGDGEMGNALPLSPSTASGDGSWATHFPSHQPIIKH
jgi:hypothetical protein